MINKIDIRDYNQLFNYPKALLTEEDMDLVDEIFYGYIDREIPYSITDTPGFDDIICVENFFPAFVGKDIESGKWIRVKTDVGYNVYYAKHSNKVLNPQQIKNKFKRLRNKKLAKGLTLDEIDSNLELIEKQKEMLDEMTIATVVDEMPGDLKFVKALRTRTQWMFLLPHQYEIVEDIQPYVEAALDKANKNAVNYRQLFTKQDEDQIFYLQSRGISRDVAIMMARLEQCYFTVNVSALFSEVITRVE